MKFKRLPVAGKALLASSPTPRPRPADFSGLLEKIKPVLPPSLALRFPALIPWPQWRPPDPCPPPPCPQCQNLSIFGETCLFIYCWVQVPGGWDLHTCCLSKEGEKEKQTVLQSRHHYYFHLSEEVPGTSFPSSTHRVGPLLALLKILTTPGMWGCGLESRTHL